MRIDLNAKNEIDTFIRRLDAHIDRASETINKINKNITEYNALAKQLEEGARQAGIWNSQIRTLGFEANDYLNNLDKKLKDLGMSLSDFPNAGVLMKRIDVIDKLLLKRLSAGENINPPRFGNLI